MKVIIAMDSFKGSIDSYNAGRAVEEGIKTAVPGVCTKVIPVADGGEGTVESLINCQGGEKISITVCGPMGNPVNAEYGIITGKNIAVIEMAAAAGITLTGENKNPLLATTYGVGEMIRDAVNRGCRHFVVGIGGSATNDGGMGMLTALGYDFLDREGRQIKRGAEGLKDLYSIKADNLIPELKDCTFRIACDVTNPLCGENGCSRVYGPQKGATEEMIQNMDLWLRRYADVTKTINDESDDDYPGAGAAGGMGFAFLSYTNATLEPGIEMILDEIGFEAIVKDADIVVTGEGRMDSQSIMGKTPVGIAKVAKKYNKKVIALAGSVADEAVACNLHGIDAIFSIIHNPVTLEEAMDTDVTRSSLSFTANQIFRLLI